MTAPTSFYADFQGLAELKGAAAKQDPNALREAARQFESIFTQMMLKSMRSASLGESLLDNEQSKFYLDMFDNQMAVHLSKGRGLGLADMLVKQLQGLQGGSEEQGGHALVRPNESSEKKNFPLPRQEQPFKPLPAAAVVPVKTTPAVPIPTAPTVGPADVTTAAPPTSKSSSIEKPSKHASFTAGAKPMALTPDEFVAQLWPHAEAAGRELGVDPRTLIAHAALETGWGKSVPCNTDGSCSFNLFGIKATGSWQGERIGVNTIEFEGGVATRRRESFRAYASPAESFKDYAALLKSNRRYASALGTADDAQKFASALQQGGYATDPNYANKLAATAASVVTRSAAVVKDALLKTSDLRPLSVIGGVASDVVSNVMNRVASGLASARADRTGGER